MTVELVADKLFLQPICCRYCNGTKFITYIEFEMELHLSEIHDMRSDRMINDAINEGKRLGAKINDSSIQKKDREYTKYKEKTTAYEEGLRLWSQAKDAFNFVPFIPVDEFFEDDYNKQYAALGNHPLELSPCYPIVGAKSAGRHILYYCEICHPEFANNPAVGSIHLAAVEHHCKYKDPERHKAEILARLEGWLK